MSHSSINPTSRRAEETSPGSHLPAPCFTSTDAWNPEDISTLVVYCSDGRWGSAFDEFCHSHLRIPRYDRWAVAGGPVCLLPRDFDEGYGRGVWEQIDLLVRVHELRRVVLIAHYGCAYYAERLGKGPEDCLPAQAEDLHAAAEILRQRFRGIGVETYVAMRQGVRLSFHPLDS